MLSENEMEKVEGYKDGRATDFFGEPALGDDQGDAGFQG
jgi:hypothetical protein